MAEPESILQLGIEAARDGNKDEARSLFRLLTRQEPQNAQAWLWLAGVAENRSERQAALEQVITLDPGNDMALKGLQALGVRPTTHLKDVPATEPPPVESPAPSAPVTPPVDTSRNRYDVDEDDPFAALDTLSEAMSEAPSAVRRNEPRPSEADEFDDLSAAIASSPGAISSRGSTPSSKPRSSESPRLSSSSRRASRPVSVGYDDDDDTVPVRRGINPLLTAIVVLAILALLVIFLWPLFFGEENEVVTAPPTQQTTLAATNAAATAEVSPAATSPVIAGGAAGTTQPPAEATAAPPTSEAPAPTAIPAPTPVPADVSQASPAIVNANTPLESNGWLYDFKQPNYASPIIGPLGSFQPQGRFVVVLLNAENRTGRAQPVPPNFFVLKDAQGRVYEARPDVSAVYVNPGVNADLGHLQPLPADGLTRSIALIFDVAPDATDLVFFARSNPAQGWLVLRRV